MSRAEGLTVASAARFAVVSAGFCLYITLISLSSWSTPIYLYGAVGSIENAFDIFCAFFWLASLACFAAFLGASKMPPSLRFLLRAPVVACILPAGYFLLTYAYYVPIFQLGFLVAAGVLVGWGNAGYFMTWEKVLFVYGVQRSKMVHVVATLFSIVPYSLVAGLGHQEQLPAITFVLAPLCLVFLMAALKISGCGFLARGSERVDGEAASLLFAERLPDKTLLRESVIPLICIFSLGIIGQTVNASPSFGISAADQVMLSHVACVISAVTLFVFWVIYKSSVPITLLFYVISPFVGVALILLTFGPASLWLPIMVLVKMILILLSMVTMIACLLLAKRYQMSVVPVFGLYGFILLLAQIAGILLSSFIARISNGENELVLTTVALIYILSLVLTAILLLRHRQARQREVAAGMGPVAAAGGVSGGVSGGAGTPGDPKAAPAEVASGGAGSLKDAPEAGGTVMAAGAGDLQDASAELAAGAAPEGATEAELPLDRTEAVCGALAAGGKLTNRETDVLILLARGRNAKAIAGQLFLSENTVRTYIKQIYQKLDIHSKQELFNLLDEHPLG